MFAWLMRLFRKLNPLAEPMAVLRERTEQAQDELEQQRHGVHREAKQRSEVEAEINRMIISSTRDVLRRRPSGRRT